MKLWGKYLFLDQNAYASMLGVILFQGCYSVAPIFLALAINSNGNTSLGLDVGLFFLLNYLPYGITAFSYYYQTKWEVNAKIRIAKEILDAVSHKYGLLQSKKEEQGFVALASGNSQAIVSEVISYVYGIASSLTSSILTLGVLSIFAKPTLILAYVTSATLCALLILANRDYQRKMSRIREHSLNAAIGILGGAWATSILNQSPFSSRLNRVFNQKWDRYKKRALVTSKAFQTMSNLQAFIIWGPMIIAILHLVLTEPKNQAVMLLGFAPRIVELLLDISHLVMRLVTFSFETGRLQWLDGEIKSFQQNNSIARISDDRLYIQEHGSSPKTLSALGGTEYLIERVKSPGRILVTGGNGAGKTSLLLALKVKLDEKAHYLSATHRQLTCRKDESVGEHLLRELKQILIWAADAEQPILLLDEWNANLDERNQLLIDEIIQELEKKAAIIEVRHHSLMKVATDELGALI